MSTLYKFCSVNGLQRILDNNTLSWSKIGSFNDPFEGLFKIDHSIEIQIRFELISTLTKGTPSLLDPLLFGLYRTTSDNNLLTQMISFGNFIIDTVKETNLSTNFSLEEFKSIEKKLISRLYKYEHLLKEYKINKKKTFIEELERDLYKLFSNDLYILCLSKSSKKNSCLQNNLMWAHYANDNKGVCLELNKDSITRAESYLIKDNDKNSHVPIVDITKATNSDDNFIDVNYEESPPSINKDNLLGLLGSEKKQYNNLITKMIATKSSHWKYENEIRHIFFNNAKKDVADRLNCILPENSIEKIYLGCNFKRNFNNNTEKMNLYIKDIKNKLPNTKIFQSNLTKNRYSYLFEEI